MNQKKPYVIPKLQLLNSEQINYVHQNSVKILEETGIKVESKKARTIFAKSDSVKITDEIVYIKKELINHSIKHAPSDITIYKKTGEIAFHLGKKQLDETYFGIGVTNTWFQNIENYEVELFRRKHMQNATKLGDILKNFEMVSTIGIPSDVPVGKTDYYSILDMYANTSKPLILLISGENTIKYVFELLALLHGDFSEKPFCITYVNPITPLVMNKSTTDKMIASIEKYLPIMYSNYSMYGGSSPITPAGSLTLLNAELLAGLVFSQLIREGSKIILGSLPAAFNMTSMGSYYTPTSYLLNLGCAEMMDYYDIPHCGTSGSGNGRGADLLASGDLWLNHLTSCMGKIGCAPFVGGNFDSMAFSPTTVVLSDHIIGEARKFAKGFILSHETVNLHEINKMGHGGNFFTSEQTLEFLNELNFKNDIWASLSMEDWRKKNMISADKELTDYTLEIYSKAEKASNENMDIINKGEEFIDSLKI